MERRRLHARVNRRNIRARFQQQPHDFGVALVGGHHQRRILARVQFADVHALRDSLQELAWALLSSTEFRFNH